MTEIEKFNAWLDENHSSFKISDRIMEEYIESRQLKMFSLENVRSIIKWLNENYSKIEDELAKPFQDESKDLPDDFFESAYETALDKAIQSLQQTEWDVEVNEFNQVTKILWTHM